ncbi:MAG: WD40 repeat domain-containing protein, partial [Alkalinema sp. RU_4_3]|nr:WD40 repeat domain-containing protein [Alkalinema sp. RU_4_3]
HLQEKRCLLILDNAESLLAPSNDRPYRPGYENYNTFFTKLATLPHQSCILLTSREKLAHLTRHEGIQKPVRILELTGLTSSEGQQIFTAIDHQFQGQAQSWPELITRYDGNPLALELAAHHIKDSFGGNIDSFLTSGNPLFNDLRDLLDWHFDRLTLTEQELLYWLAIHREPSTLQILQEDILTPTHLPDTLQTLQQKIPLERGDRGQQFSLQPVLIEYLTDKLIQQISDEIIHFNINLLNRFALCPAQDKDYIRETQNRLILQPILKQLIESLGSQQNLETHLRKLLQHLRETQPRHPGYTAGNILNLLTHLQAHLQTFDFSQLALWQADLQQGQWDQVNFSQADFHRSRFSQAFGGIHSLAYSPDGQTLAAGDSDGNIRLLTADGSQQLALLAKHEWWTAGLAYSPDGSKIASITLYPVVRLWDTETGQCIHTLLGHSEGCWGDRLQPRRQNHRQC